MENHSSVTKWLGVNPPLHTEQTKAIVSGSAFESPVAGKDTEFTLTTFLPNYINFIYLIQLNIYL
jgi:hypothetical protein